MDTNGKISSVQLAVTPELSVSGSIGVPQWWPSGDRAGVVLAHDSNTNLNQPLLVTLQEALVAKGFLTIRFNFPYAEERRKRPDPMSLLERTYRLAVEALRRDPQEAPAQLVAAGFGLGAKVASQAIASGLKADGLICVGYPLHPAGKPSKQKADALFRIICPILFVQGSRDTRCRLDRLELLRRRIGAPTEVAVVEDADHHLNLIKRSSRTREDVTAELLRATELFLHKATGA